MSAPPALSPLELSSLVASRICHDLSGAVGAIVNGIELIDEEDAGATKDLALDLIGRSARQLSARLQFARLAFGSFGGHGEIALEEVLLLVRGGLATERLAIDWQGAVGPVPRLVGQLTANLVEIASSAIPRGGHIAVTCPARGEGPIEITATADVVRLPAHHEVLTGGSADAAVEPRAVQAYLAHAIAGALGRRIELAVREGALVLTA